MNSLFGRHISFSIFMHVSLHTHTDQCMFAYLHTYEFLPPYTSKWIHTYIYRFMHVYLPAYICTYQHIHAYMPAEIWMSIHAYTMMLAYRYTHSNITTLAYGMKWNYDSPDMCECEWWHIMWFQRFLLLVFLHYQTWCTLFYYQFDIFVDLRPVY